MSEPDYPIFEMHTDERGNPSVRISDKVTLLTKEQSEQVLERFKSLEAENDKLRKLAILQSILFRRMSACPTTDCKVCPVKEECAEFVHLEGILGIDDKETGWLVQWRNEDATDIQAENSKLKELTTQALKIIKHVNAVMAIDWASYSTVMSMARELGIEVPE